MGETPHGIPEPTGPYFDEAGRPVLRESWVAFLDTLGSRERIASMTNERLAVTRSLFHRGRPLLGGFSLQSQMTLGFTDNVILAIPRDEDYDDATGSFTLLDVALKDVGEFQWFNAMAGRFLRGGLVSGPIFVEPSLATGQAIVDAYRLESVLARFPRVVLGHAMLNDLMQHRSAAVREREAELEGSRQLGVAYHPYAYPVERMVLVDLLDEQVFINYWEGPERGEVGIDAVRTHRDFVALQLSVCPDEARDKYLWLAQYHNYWAPVDLHIVHPDLRRLPDPRERFVPLDDGALAPRRYDRPSWSNPTQPR